MKFERLDPRRHDRAHFDCGVEELNRYLRQFANQDQRRNLTQLYVLADAGQVIGYYSISAHSVTRDGLPEEIRAGGYNDVPFLLLGRLAVDQRYQGQGYGDALIFHAFKTTVEAAAQVGILGMAVDAKDEKAAHFHAGFGFRRLTGGKHRLVLPLPVIRKWIRQQEPL